MASKYNRFSNEKSGVLDSKSNIDDCFFFSDDTCGNSTQTKSSNRAATKTRVNRFIPEAPAVFIEDSSFCPMGEALTKSSPELTQPVKCEVVGDPGKIPSWLSGAFIRLGPGKFEWGQTSYKHAFDGDCLVHKYEIRNGEVFYSNRFLEVNDLELNFAVYFCQVDQG